VLKWLTLVLFAYVACMFMVKVPWTETAKSLVIPSMRWDTDYLTTVVAVLVLLAGISGSRRRPHRPGEADTQAGASSGERSTESISTPSSAWDSRTLSRWRS
jgi:hypothetical protein